MPAHSCLCPLAAVASALGDGRRAGGSEGGHLAMQEEGEGTHRGGR